MTEVPKKTEGLVDILGLEDLPEEDKAQLTSGMVQLLSDRIILRVIKLLTPEEKKTLSKMIEAGDDEKVNEYILKLVPGINAIAYSEYELMKEELLIDKAEIEEGINDYEKHMKDLAKK